MYRIVYAICEIDVIDHIVIGKHVKHNIIVIKHVDIRYVCRKTDCHIPGQTVCGRAHLSVLHHDDVSAGNNAILPAKFGVSVVHFKLIHGLILIMRGILLIIRIEMIVCFQNQTVLLDIVTGHVIIGDFRFEPIDVFPLRLIFYMKNSIQDLISDGISLFAYPDNVVRRKVIGYAAQIGVRQIHIPGNKRISLYFKFRIDAQFRSVNLQLDFGRNAFPAVRISRYAHFRLTIPDPFQKPRIADGDNFVVFNRIGKLYPVKILSVHCDNGLDLIRIRCGPVLYEVLRIDRDGRRQLHLEVVRHVYRDPAFPLNTLIFRMDDDSRRSFLDRFDQTFRRHRRDGLIQAFVSNFAVSDIDALVLDLRKDRHPLAASDKIDLILHKICEDVQISFCPHRYFAFGR